MSKIDVKTDLPDNLVIGKTVTKGKLTQEQRLARQEALVKLVFASLFAGCGGSSLGYWMARFEELLAVEWDQNARSTFNKNFPGIPALNLDISKLSGEELLQILGLRRGELDLLDASPPCQDFSSANTARNADTVRNNLYFKTLDLIGYVMPKVFVIENVEGMKKGKMKKVYNQIVAKLATMDYYIETKVVFAEEHGVPQERRRLIMIGVRKDIHNRFGMVNLFPEPDLDNVPNMALNKVLPHLIAFSSGQFDDKIILADRPVCTITKTPSLWVYEKDGIRRKPTTWELKVLSTFPEEFEFTGSPNQHWARIGNAVPPNITKAIGLHIRNHILTPEVIAWCNENPYDGDGLSMAA